MSTEVTPELLTELLKAAFRDGKIPENFDLKDHCPFLAELVEDANKVGEVVSAQDEKALFCAYF
jgi:hypothetical protein